MPSCSSPWKRVSPTVPRARRPASSRDVVGDPPLSTLLSCGNLDKGRVRVTTTWADPGAMCAVRTVRLAPMRGTVSRGVSGPSWSGSVPVAPHEGDRSCGCPRPTSTIAADGPSVGYEAMEMRDHATTAESVVLAQHERLCDRSLDGRLDCVTRASLFLSSLSLCICMHMSTDGCASPLAPKTVQLLFSESSGSSSTVQTYR